MAWKYILWYYKQMEIIYVPSRAIGEELEQKGISKKQIRYCRRGVDTNMFHPSKRNGFFSNNFKIAHDQVKLLYVGRVSKEKNLPFLVQVFKEVCARRENLHLVVVGAGPYLDEMKQALTKFPATFTGFLREDDLSQAYASSDIFVFPSTTDTFGNVVLEAQASGIPAIVSDKGGPKENVVHSKSGFVLSTNDRSAFVNTILWLAHNPERLNQLKRKARVAVENRSFEASYLRLWENYKIPFSSKARWEKKGTSNAAYERENCS
jgi:glycosyltransferase involved in cell wall biosynthesis